ncbi:hypothetical protein FACS1894184_12650 [Clostridia bacterium]|nr:hypothetical protein FACS1894184_12650 [Clostridia bacterium]
MELLIYNTSRELTGVLESIEYFKWTRRYSKAGSFVIKAIGSSENAALLQIGNYVWKNDDQEIGMIEHLELSQTDKEMITVSGRFVTALLDRRIIWGTEFLNGDIGACIGQMIDHHLVHPTDPARQVDFVSFTSPSFGIPVHNQVSYKNLYEVVTDLCDAADVGIRTVFTPQTGAMVISLYQGVMTQAVFSREYENLISQTFIHNIAESRDTVVVAGEGDGEERMLVSIDGASGEDRREIFVDARDLQSENFPDNYEQVLLFRGQSKLAEYAEVKTFDAEVNMRGNLIYKTDFDLGSIVTVQSRRWGVSLQTRITEITESYDQSGLSIDVVFGRGMLTLTERLKGKVI